MSQPLPDASAPSVSSPERAQQLWADLNARYFRGTLPPIPIEWSRRLTSSAGMFVSRVGPRAHPDAPSESRSQARLIRLSTPLLQRRSDWSEGALISTLAHEMIHQWQFDVLKRRPNHGPDFCRKMAELNRDGLGITIRHAMQDAVRALAKYVWRCRRCGRSYERQRRTIRPGRHRCGACRGPLREIGAGAAPEPAAAGRPLRDPAAVDRLTRPNRGARPGAPLQLELGFPTS